MAMEKSAPTGDLGAGLQRPKGKVVWVTVIKHPGGIVRGDYASEPQQYEYLKRARCLAGGSWEPLDHDTLIGGVLQHPTLVNLRSWFARVIEERPTLAVDIECAGPHLVCIGFYAVEQEGGIVVRFRGDGGVTLWGDDLEEVVCWCYRVLADPTIPKWFHNGQAFDIPYLTYQGFRVEGYAGDTMLLQRYMFPEMEAALQSCAIFYCGIPAWKYLASDINKDEESDNK